MAENDFEKTESPTPRRREEARQEGNVARSTDLTAAVVLLGAMLLLYVLGEQLLGGMRLTLVRMLSFDPGSNPARPGDLGALLAFSGRAMMESLLPFMFGVMAIAGLATVGQVGFLWSNKPLVPDFSRLSPLRGFRNLVDVRAAVRLIMGLAKIAAIVLVAVMVILNDVPRILKLAEMDTGPLFSGAASMVFWLGLKLAVLLLLLGVLDFAFQRWKREQDLRMTKQDLKEELKRMEGDPLIKQRRSRVARQLALQRIGHVVPKADVIVTNPTHYALALKYDSRSMKAPKLTAKGVDFLAMRIRQLAALHGVPIVERRELAQAIYRTVEVGQEVPSQFYGAVAEILAYVYRLSGRKSA